MAYDQGYYQPPQRPYNGRAAQRPGPPQSFGQPAPPQQQYPPQDFDQYAQDDYGYDSYDNRYAQHYNGPDQYHDMNGEGRGDVYPPQNQSYHPQQEYYGDARGGGGMPPPSRGRGMPGPAPRPPTADGYRGVYDERGGGQGRGHPNGPPGRGRPAQLDRAPTSDPGRPRKPLKTPPMSPDTTAWDNPFPTFPGGKRKTSLSEEQKIIQQMADMDVGAPPPQNRPRTAGSKSSQDRYGGRGPTDDYGRPSTDSQRRPVDEYGRPSVESQRSMAARDYPPRGPSRGPPQGYPDQRRGLPPPGPVYNGPPRQNGYRDPAFNDRGGYGSMPTSPIGENFGPPGRSMTMPNEPPVMSGGRPGMQMNGARSDERPYNGPIGRGMPPRPSTATGTRPTPHRTYPTPDPVQPPPQQYPGSDPYPNSKPPNKIYHQPDKSISDLYDAYYEPPILPQYPSSARSNESEIPNFDVFPAEPPAQRRGTSIDDHVQPAQQRGNSFESQNGYHQAKPMKSQPDLRARAQPQAAVFEMAAEATQMPDAYPPQGYPEDGYGQYAGQPSQRGPQAQGYGEPNQPPTQNRFPPRIASAQPHNNGLPSAPKPGFNGLPGVSPSHGGPPNGLPRPSPPANVEALPSHPPPVRAGLIPNSVAAQANNKPPPVRNYNNVSPAPQPIPSQQPVAPTAPAGPPPVTAQELEQLRSASKMNPGDQALQMTLARKLVEASDVLTPAIPDQKQRNKTRERYVMDAHKLLKKLVAAQNSEAMFYLADCYGRGALGLEIDNKEAFTLYQSAAKLGHAAAAYRTAVCCELGNDEGGGTRKDPLKAIQWYKRAAMLGDTPAMYKMGMIQLKGLLGQPKNPREAVAWLKRAAEHADVENPHALHELALLYEKPQDAEGSIIHDEAYAFSLFQQAADLGYKFSQFRLGCAYEYGLFNCAIDPRQSIMWYSRAAVQEEHQSELALSGWYLTGSEGVLQQSDTEAYLWARKAAMAGLAKAEYAMGYFTEVGIGSPASLEDAKRWYWRAAAQNFPKARERLEDLKKGGSKADVKSRERISRSKVGKANEGECAAM